MELIIFLLMLFFLSSSKPRPRRRRRNYTSNYYSGGGYSGKRSPFKKAKPYSGRVYSYNPQPNEFLVYMVENKRLNSLKVGVGTYGRVHQLLNSYVEPNFDSEKVGWEVLRLAKFSTSEIDYEEGKVSAYEAEKRAHFYWRYVLKEPRNLEQAQMGYSQMDVLGVIQFVQTQGFSETVRMDKVCEASTWNFVIKSPGFIEEVSGTKKRDLTLSDAKSHELDIPEGYLESKIKRIYHKSRQSRSRGVNRFDSRERFWNKVEKTETCWNWKGATNHQGKYGYGIANYEKKSYPAHRLAWILEVGSDPGLFLLDNNCGNRSCVNPSHWKISLRRRSAPGEIRISEFQCITKGCQNQARTMTKPGLCEPCKQRAKRNRRKNRNLQNTFKCQICGKDAESRGNPKVLEMCKGCRNEL